MLSSSVISILGKTFLNGSIFYVPDKAVTFEVMKHSKSLKRWLEEYEKLNHGTVENDPIRRELGLYIAALDQVAASMLVLEVIPIVGSMTMR